MLVIAAPASAAWLTASDLERHCAEFSRVEETRGGAICAAFIQGVLAGERAASTGFAPEWAPGSFTERAARTRAGGRLAQSPRPWCVDADLPAATVIERVVAQLGSAPRSAEPSADGLVRAALAAGFPCSGP